MQLEELIIDFSDLHPCIINYSSMTKTVINSFSNQHTTDYISKLGKLNCSRDMQTDLIVSD